MTEVGPAELSRLLQTRRNECSAIVTSRKRKLRELFAVATQADALPDDGFSNPDAPAATPAEWQFLQASDILQGKTLNEQNIPARPRPSLDKLRRLLGESSSAAISHAPTESPAGLIRKAASSDAANQVLARHVASTKSSSVAPLVAKIPPPTTPVKPAPITKPSHSSTQPPGHPVKATSKPLAAADPPTRNGDHGTPRRRNGETNGYPKGDSTAKRPAQVKFPPGTKGSPSADLTSKPPATPTSTDAAKGMVRGDFDAPDGRF
ncbi:hypothetical protein CDD83_6787 [Cordyceps sp. RAO-2017]|nr:hypothetical protein CDD83_6787 [Cordyceps sp. RAO-2017]